MTLDPVRLFPPLLQLDVTLLLNVYHKISPTGSRDNTKVPFNIINK